MKNSEILKFQSNPKKNRNFESKAQQEWIKWFRLQYPKYKNYLYAIPNGGKRGGKLITAKNGQKISLQGIILKKEGVLAGVPDMFFSIPSIDNHGLYIEAKHGKNTLSEEQKEKKELYEKVGYGYRICNSFEKFKSAVENQINGFEQLKIEI